MISSRRLSIVVRGLSVLDAVSIRADDGQCVGVSGPSGSGKTTLLQAFAGRLRPTAGSIHLDDEERPADAFALRRSVGYAAVEAIVGDGLTVAEYLRFVAQIKAPGTSVDASAHAAATRGVGLSPATAIAVLAPAQRAALAIAAAVVTPVRVVLIDEAVDALALSERARVVSWLLEIRNRGVAMLVATNDADVQTALCHRVLKLVRGAVANELNLTAPPGAMDSYAEVGARSL